MGSTTSRGERVRKLVSWRRLWGTQPQVHLRRADITSLDRASRCPQLPEWRRVQERCQRGIASWSQLAERTSSPTLHWQVSASQGQQHWLWRIQHQETCCFTVNVQVHSQHRQNSAGRGSMSRTYHLRNSSRVHPLSPSARVGTRSRRPSSRFCFTVV